jgi:hypothetical protein
LKWWKKWNTDIRPSCGQPEKAEHVWSCRGNWADIVWNQSIEPFQEWLRDANTNPEIAEAIVSNINHWRAVTQAARHYSWRVQNAVDQQSDIGWQYSLEGWLSIEWEMIQQEYLKDMGSKASGKWWITELIKKLWGVAWDLWEHHNGSLHEQSNLVVEMKEEEINKNVQRLFHIATSVLSNTHDSYLLLVPLSQLLRRSLTYKETWLCTTTAAVMVQRRFTSRTRKGACQNEGTPPTMVKETKAEALVKPLVFLCLLSNVN